MRIHKENREASRLVSVYKEFFDDKFIKKTSDATTSSKAELKNLRAKQYNEPNSYVDAIQIARRGKPTTIKADTYIDRASYIQHPQDNTKIAATINKVHKGYEKTGNEHGAVLYKDNGKLKVSKVVTGTYDSVKPALHKPKDKESLVNIHAHPRNRPNPSIQDLHPFHEDKTKLIVSKNKDNTDKVITKYKAINDLPTNEELYKVGNRSSIVGSKRFKKLVREKDGDYKFIDKNTKQ